MGFLDRITLKRLGKGLNFGGIEKYVTLPMITAFFLPGSLVLEVTSLIVDTEARNFLPEIRQIFRQTPRDGVIDSYTSFTRCSNYN